MLEGNFLENFLKGRKLSGGFLDCIALEEQNGSENWTLNIRRFRGFEKSYHRKFRLAYFLLVHISQHWQTKNRFKRRRARFTANILNSLKGHTTEHLSCFTTKTTLVWSMGLFTVNWPNIVRLKRSSHWVKNGHVFKYCSRRLRGPAKLFALSLLQPTNGGAELLQCAAWRLMRTILRVL